MIDGHRVPVVHVLGLRLRVTDREVSDHSDKHRSDECQDADDGQFVDHLEIA